MSGVEGLSPVERDDLCICLAAGECRTPMCDENRVVVSDILASHTAALATENIALAVQNAALREQVARVEALPEQWEGRGIVATAHAQQLRAALHPTDGAS